MKKDIPIETIRPQKEEELTFKEMVDAKIKEKVDAINEYMPEGFRLAEDEFRQRFGRGGRLSGLLKGDEGVMNEVAIEALKECLESENIEDKDRVTVEGVIEKLSSRPQF